jgi:hypothetical protein
VIAIAAIPAAAMAIRPIRFFRFTFGPPSAESYAQPAVEGKGGARYLPSGTAAHAGRSLAGRTVQSGRAPVGGLIVDALSSFNRHHGSGQKSDQLLLALTFREDFRLNQRKGAA